MSLAWLIDPQHQFMTKSGTINVGGTIRVFETVTDDPVLTFKDFSGTENELSVVLDSNGRANVIADPSKAYRVEVYDRYGTLMWTAGPVWCLDASGDGATGTDVISSDGSISVVKTVTGGMTQFDISNRVDDSTDLLEWIASSGDSEYHDGAFHLVYNAGTMEIGERGVRLGARRYYHVTAEVTVGKDVVHPVYDNIDFVLYFRDGEGALTEVAKFSRVGDYSMGLSQCWTVACDCMPDTDVELVLRVEGKDLDDAGGFTVTRFDVHRVFSGAPALPGGVQEKLVAGDNITIEGNVISANANMQEQADWAQSDSGAVDFIKNKPDLSVYATKSEVTSGLASKQDNLTPGVGITIENNVISATAAQQQQADWAQTDTSAVDFIKNKPDLSVYATETDVETALSGKQDTLTAGDNITIEGNVISASAAPQEQADWTQTDTAAVDFIKNKPDLATVATSGSYNDLSNKPTIPAAQVQSDWNESDSSAVDFIKNKPALATVATSGSYNDLSNTPDLSGYATTTQLEGKQDVLTAGDNITITNNVISATAAPQEQADWSQTNTSAVDFIKNKPTEKTVVAGSNMNITETANSVVFSATAELQEQADWSQTDTAAVDFIKNKPDLSVYAIESDVETALSGKQDSLTAGNNITIENNVISATAAPQEQADWSQTNTSAVDFIKNKPTEKTVVAGSNMNITETANSVVFSATAEPQEQADWAQTNTSAVDFIKNKPVIPAAQVQSDWTQVDTTAVDFIKNKPSIPAAQVQTDWDETDSAMPSYLMNKPETQELIAGENIEIDTTVTGQIIISGTAAPQVQSDWDETDSALPEYIQNKPDLVDIVAGPGIVVDNPDGNTLRVSVAQNYETVLWEGTVGSTGAVKDLSESTGNFETIRIYTQVSTGTTERCIQMFDMQLKFSSTQGLAFVHVDNISDGNLLSEIIYLKFNGSANTFELLAGCKWSNGTFSQNISNYDFNVVKVSGIHRIANN